MVYFNFKNVRFSFSFGFFFIVGFVCSYSNVLALYSLVFCILHELAHLYAMRFYGVSVSEVLLYGAGIKITSDGISQLTKVKQLVIYSAGCFVNLFMSFIYLIINSQELMMINLCLAFINFLPIDYLDGGKILEVIFTNKEKALKAVSIITTVSVIIMLFYHAFSVREFNFTSLTVTAFVFILSLILG